MSGLVSTDEFLEMEEESRRNARLRAPAREVRRFHAAVRRFAGAWVTKPTRRITADTSEEGASLHLEIDDGGRWIPVMALRAGHASGEFGLLGPNPVRKRKMSAKMREAMEGLLKTWKSLPGAEPESNSVVLVRLPKLADVGFDRFLEVTIEACSDL